jgi:uroporphyrinogen-III synthase
VDVLPLDGCTVGITADRRREEQAELLRRRGADVREGPVIKTVPLQSDDALRQATESLIADPPDVLVATTGIGVRSLFGAAQAWGIDGDLIEALRSVRIAVRGPKSAGAVQSAGLDVWWQEPSERLDLMLQRVADELGLPAGSPNRPPRIALQRYGHPVPWAVRFLHDAGAEVLELPIYQWTLPDDRTAAYRLIEAACDLHLDAITLTSPPAVDNLFRLATDIGAAERLRTVLNRDVQVVCVGPMSGEAAQAQGLSSSVWPERGRLGLMIRTLTEQLQRRHSRLTLANGQGVVVLQGCALVWSGGLMKLSDRERAVLRILARRPGTVSGRETLLREVWGDPATDRHLVDVTMARLRSRLAPTGLRLVTVPRRGYRLEGLEDLD